MMETPGFSVWILLMLFALLMVLLWGTLFLFLGIGTWIIAKTRLRDTDKPERNDWDA